MGDQHSKEPWRVGKSGDSVVCDDATGVRFPALDDAELNHYGGQLVCESVSAADQRRIVACVNACAGISTEALEAVAREERWLLCVRPTGERRGSDGAHAFVIEEKHEKGGRS